MFVFSSFFFSLFPPYQSRSSLPLRENCSHDVTKIIVREEVGGQGDVGRGEGGIKRQEEEKDCDPMHSFIHLNERMNREMTNSHLEGQPLVCR